MKIISYYTALYQFEAEKLIRSLKKIPSLEYEVELKDDSGSWEKNCQYKAIFIKEKLLQNDSVIWTDADSTVNQYPILFEDIDHDAAFCWFGDELLSGTMYFRNRPKTFELLDTWIDLNSHNMEWDQRNLDTALSVTHGIDVYPLPPQYCFITDLSRERYGNLSPVFEHFQASRQYKRRNG
jgi:hypothetical protein